MRRHFDDFDREFTETKKTIKRWQVVGMVLIIVGALLVFSLIGIVIYAIGQFVGMW